MATGGKNRTSRRKPVGQPIWLPFFVYHATMTRRSIVYIDGFNLYYGAVKDGPHKWLDLAGFFKMLRRDDDLQRVHYFTAMVGGDPGLRQGEYVRALMTTDLINVVLGKFKTKEVDCRVDTCCHAGRRKFRVSCEKRTDVQIALQMLEDAYEDRCDTFILVSGDSDLVPAVRRVLDKFRKKKVLVYVPCRDPERGAAVELRQAATNHRNLPINMLKMCQFPAEMPDGAGGIIRKPLGW